MSQHPNHTTVRTYDHELLDCRVTEMNSPEWSLKRLPSGRLGLEVYALKNCSVIVMNQWGWLSLIMELAGGGRDSEFAAIFEAASAARENYTNSDAL